MIPCVIKIKDGVVDELTICTNGDHAEKVFLDLCKTHISNWDEYTQDDIDAIL